MNQRLVYAMHAVIIKKDGLKFDEAKKMAEDIIKDPKKHYYRETEDSWRWRYYPKTYFDSKSFKSKVINKNITLVFGKLLEKWSHLK
jgi:hypothetical protein